MTKEYELKVDPRILELLGPNLYTNIYYVLAELIANAYDADANNVYIVSNKDDIRVEDDGHGMSYENGDIESYLNVAGVSRTNEGDSFTRSGRRLKMGRKGVGKLAALSVSEDVDILTVADGEKSGFVLTRYPDPDSMLRAIDDSEVVFEYVEDHGSAIVMRNPQYRLHKTLSAIKRNILKIFPLVDSDFRIHIIRGNETEIVEDFDRNIIKELGALITLGEAYAPLCDLVPNLYPGSRSDLVTARDQVSIPLTLFDQKNVEHEYQMVIKGWIGTYQSTRGRKAEITDFPDNFISIFANQKMGEFNILPLVGQNKMGEAYVIGQFHIDLFELSELPDMALSNRQGYKFDDPRYASMLEQARSLLNDILKMRDKFTDLRKAKVKQRKVDDQQAQEQELKRNVDVFRQKSSEGIAQSVLELGNNLTREAIEEIVSEAINDNSPDIGLKSIIDSQKKKILISQTLTDKPLADIIYQMLIFNGVPAEEIIYTNCDDEVSRVPEGYAVYEYLKTFFVDSYSTQKILALFVTSENTKISWGAITEVGAAWITQIDHKIFNIHPFSPGHPLDNHSAWQSTNRDSSGLWVTPLNADILCVKIESVCDLLGYEKKARPDNRAYLDGLVQVRES
ncbi:ATP-binding protein [Haliea sp.]